MISPHEREIYERMQLPLILFSVSGGEYRAELVSDGLCDAAWAERMAFLDQLNTDLYSRVHPDDRGWMLLAFENFLHRMTDFDVVFRNRPGREDSYCMVHAIGKWQRMQDGTEMMAIAYYDMLDPEAKLGQLFSYANQNDPKKLYRDGVTGLPNLVYLRQFSGEHLHNLRTDRKTPVLLYCNVKSLDEYNTLYGYAKGDVLMRLYAGLLKEAFPDAMITRGADDHFVVIDAYTDDEDIDSKIKTINEKARRSAYGSPRGIQVGVCRVDPDVDVAKAMDHARHAVKEIGDDLNTFCRFYSPERDEVHWMEHYILENLERAMENRWIKPYYQGIVCVATGELTLFESLARWIDPERGIILPADFIPALSHYHLLYKLDLCMAEQVCRDFVLRKEAGRPLIPVTVNFSAQDFDYVDVADELNSILARYDLPHKLLIVEITEQDIAQGTEQFRAQLKKIRENGYKLWIDDFGSAYSSLNVFSQYDIDSIKFDMELLRHLDDNNGANRRVLRALIDICREMGVRTLAEGVETTEQLDFLKEIDCGMAQGFLFCKPAPLEPSISGTVC